MTLADELSQDPEGLGYAGKTPVEQAVLINAVNRSRDRVSMSGREVAAEIVDAEYDPLSAVVKAHVLALVAGDDLDPFGFAADRIKEIFPGSVTLANLAVARVELISRAQELGFGRVKGSQIGAL